MSDDSGNTKRPPAPGQRPAPQRRRKERVVVNKRDPVTAVNVLQAMLEKGNSPLAQDFKRYRLKLDWPKVVGTLIAGKCSPVAFSNGMLFIYVVNAAWMNQLYFARQELLKKINEYGGGQFVTAIRFTQDRRDVPPGSDTFD